ncbi:MAG: acetate--CoA ligase family protein [Bacteroidales bacterium]|nr:acetate--CoA ligase family protein [Bacteroidales bacterium]
MLDAAGIRRAKESVVSRQDDAIAAAQTIGFPLVMKVVGPVHKSDVGGVVLNVKDVQTLCAEFERLIQIKDTTGILLQPMLSGTELFAGIKKEDKFGHLVLFGLGGIFIEVLKDVRAVLAPAGRTEVENEIRKLNSYKIIQGARGSQGVDEDLFLEIIRRLSALVKVAPEIVEMDLNPLLGTQKQIVAVDARIRVEK